MGFVLALLCACALAFQKASAGWTTDLANNCISDIESAIEASLTGRRLQGGKGGKGGKGGGAARQGGSTRRLIPQLVRLSFHDCVGGCDGCVNLDDPDNAGLAGPRTSLETIYSDRGLADEGVSRADLWALAGKVAVEYAALLAGSTISIPFYTGRSDCADSPGTSSIDGMPSAHLDTTGVINFFSDRFGFTEREAMVIMGAHTLGRANNDNSGFNGGWVDARVNEDRLNVEYYRDMLVENWNQVTSPAGKWEWKWGQNNQLGLMLNADMALMKSFSMDSDGQADCQNTNDCSDASTASTVREFATNNDQWLSDFASAFSKMVQNGNSGLSELSVTATTLNGGDPSEMAPIDDPVEDLQNSGFSLFGSSSSFVLGGVFFSFAFSLALL